MVFEVYSKKVDICTHAPADEMRSLLKDTEINDNTLLKIFNILGFATMYVRRWIEFYTAEENLLVT